MNYKTATKDLLNELIFLSSQDDKLLTDKQKEKTIHLSENVWIYFERMSRAFILIRKIYDANNKRKFNHAYVHAT